ncbi:2-C-methyl-D-erythritol 2,4-cyclodiphosphate synthase [Mesoterricola silvestris]|uniref:2-C-methyl-D-erythritol 2,4-cyclodiphosphate synthase n=1 Tax=Mesoterricola silvestris TaxID=2927979 RepID=A0AA48GXG3_9BACT|nr:2-C-methyl-D-erythritol 2,4-cyclodiphosphate synthase [Mesoterricola silvestris]BDU73666.1 2-C-methyl-D-erythritol 2,4-cyclodiphosphate synthase [Mesoterricola silvestris]
MIRVGQGFDVHRFAEPEAGRPLMLMGLRVPHDRGLAGHSDADVMVHALMDALLGAAGLGDIGQHFPDTDPAYRGADSVGLLAAVMADLRAGGWRVVNADVALIGERPKLAPHREAMRDRIAPVLGLAPQDLNVKATTTERLGFTGRGEGLAAQAVVLIERG